MPWQGGQVCFWGSGWELVTARSPVWATAVFCHGETLKQQEMVVAPCPPQHWGMLPTEDLLAGDGAASPHPHHPSDAAFTRAGGPESRASPCAARE